MKYLLIIGFISILIISCSNKSDSNELQMAIYHGNHHVFAIGFPKSWVRITNDPDISTGNTIPGIFFKDFKKDQNTYIYAVGFDYPNNKESLASFIYYDTNRFLSYNNKLQIVEYQIVSNTGSSPYLTGETRIFEFKNFANKYKELVAYIDGKKSIFTITLSINDSKDDKIMFDIFMQALNSFNVLSDNYEEFLKKYGDKLNLY